MWAFSKYVISNRVTVAMFVAGMMVMGLVGLGGMPWELMPDVDLPIVSIVVPYPGAGPEEIEDEVVRPIEDEVSILQTVSYTHLTLPTN